MRKWFSGRSSQAAGLDIGSSAVKAVTLEKRGRSTATYELTGLALEPLPSEVIVDGDFMDTTVVVDAIRSVFEQLDRKVRRVVLGISGRSVIVKKITLPQMTDQELAESIHWEAEHYIPFQIDEVNLDYQILDRQVGGKMDILLVAAKKDRIYDVTNLINRAGLEVAAVDVESFAIQNAYETNYGFEPASVVVLLNMGASVTNLCIVHNGKSAFTRDIALGGNRYRQLLQKELKIGAEEAEKVKMGRTVGDKDEDKIAPILEAVSLEIAAEIDKSINFYTSTASLPRLDRIVVSGGASRTPTLKESLEGRFDASVDVMNPFKNVSFGASFDSAYIEEVAPRATVAVGLAIRGGGE